MGKLEVIPFEVFMSGSNSFSLLDSVLIFSPPSLPLMEGIVGFGTLGLVLIGLSYLDKKGWVNVDESKMSASLFIGAIVGICYLMFKARVLLGI